jgi:hypothetical protein
MKVRKAFGDGMAPLFPCYNNYYGNVVISIANVGHSFGDDNNATTTTTHEEPPPLSKCA